MADPHGSKPVNGTAGSKGKEKADKSHANGTPAPSDTASSDKPGLSNAEKKKLQKAEKAARRAKDKDAAPSSVPEQSSSTPILKPQQPQTKEQAGPPSRKRRDSVAAPKPVAERLPIRSVNHEKTKVIRTIPFFTHLQNQPRKRTLEGTAKEVHPAIAQLALQLSSYVICGSHARGVAMLLAFKSVSLNYPRICCPANQISSFGHISHHTALLSPGTLSHTTCHRRSSTSKLPVHCLPLKPTPSGGLKTSLPSLTLLHQKMWPNTRSVQQLTLS